MGWEQKAVYAGRRERVKPPARCTRPRSSPGNTSGFWRGKFIDPAGRFVFSVQHPIFNSTGCTIVGERKDREGTFRNAPHKSPK
jgi:hypothetical protein